MKITTHRTPVRFGDVVRAKCTATGRYVGMIAGKAWVLSVSAMDNSLFLDEYDPTQVPCRGLPLPSLREVEAAMSAYAKGFHDGRTSK